MTRLRFSIASLLGLVLFLAVSLAALREATDVWDSAIVTGTLGLLLASVPLAVHRTERRRAFWLGFALFGWVALVASLVPPVESRLLTTKLLAYLDSKMPGRNTVEILMPDPFDAMEMLPTNPVGQKLVVPSLELAIAIQPFVPAPSMGTSQNFIRIGHLLIALLLAWLGGKVSTLLYVRSKAESDCGGG
jgi:hypothetical protein